MIARLLALAVVMSATPALAVPAKAPHVGAHRDWGRTVLRLPSGAFLLGNPAAKVKVIEYLSLTCPHCAHFALEGLPALRSDYVASGKVSVEFRHAVRDGFDLAASLLVRCGGTARYLGDIDTVFRTQNDWIAKAQGFVPPEGVADSALPAAFARRAGLDTLLAARGLPLARANACLADKAEQARLTAMRTEAFDTRAIAGTPAFVLNGTLTGVYGWDGLKPLIDAALH